MIKDVHGSKFFYGYVVAAAGFVIVMVTGGIHQVFGIFLKPLTDEFAWSRAETVLAYSIFGIVSAFTQIGGGWLTDKFGPRIIVPIIGSLIGISYVLIAHINNIAQFILCYVVSAIGFSVAFTPIMATVTRWFVKKRALMIGAVQAGVGTGGIIFAPISGWLVITYGWRQAYTILGAVALATMVIFGLLLRRDPKEVRQPLDGNHFPVQPTAHHTGKHTPKLLRQLTASHQFWVLVGIFFVFGFCRSTFLPHVPAHVQDQGFSLTDGASVVAVLTGASILGRFWMSWLSTRTGFIVSFAVTTLSLLWVMVTRNLWGLYLFAVVFGLGWGAQAVFRFTIVAEAFGLATVGLLMGIFGFSEAIAAAGGSYIAGFLFDITGSYQPAFLLGIIMSLAGILLSWRIRPIASTKI